MTKRTARMVFDRARGDYTNFTKNSDLRLIDNKIYYHNLMIAELEESYEGADNVIVGLKDFKSEPKLKQARKDIVNAAVEAGYEVIFVPEIDIGFGVSDIDDTSQDNIVKLLITVAKYSQEDIKTAVLVIVNGKILGIAFNQKDAYEYDDVIHAEQVLCNYIDNHYMFRRDSYPEFYSLLEPCEKCLKRMIDIDNTLRIYYFVNHKAKWNTEEYYQLTNDIWAKRILQSGAPIKYNKLTNIKADKFMNKEKSK